jgi:hypothetical protein
MLKLTVVLFLLFGSVALGFYLWNQSESALQTDVSVKGVYHEERKCDNSGCATTPFVAFTTKRGTPVKFYPFDINLSHQQFLAAFYDESAYHDGQSVSVLYDPAHPGQAFISSTTHLWMDALFWFALGACILLGVMVRSLRQDRRKSGPPGPPMRR